jgi:hypothetical protein
MTASEAQHDLAQPDDSDSACGWRSLTHSMSGRFQVGKQDARCGYVNGTGASRLAGGVTRVVKSTTDTRVSTESDRLYVRAAVTLCSLYVPAINLRGFITLNIAVIEHISSIFGDHYNVDYRILIRQGALACVIYQRPVVGIVINEYS